jgi:hypothetical protein
MRDDLAGPGPGLATRCCPPACGGRPPPAALRAPAAAGSPSAAGQRIGALQASCCYQRGFHHPAVKAGCAPIAGGCAWLTWARLTCA